MKQKTVLPTDVLLVNFDLTHGPERRLCIVGRKPEGADSPLQIVNAFSGEEAERILKLLTTVKEAQK